MRAFNEISFYNFLNNRWGDLVREIQSKGKDYILKVDEQQFIEYLFEKYLLQPLAIDTTSEQYTTPIITKEMVYDRSRAYSYLSEVYTFTITYNYTGSGELFCVRPDTFRRTSIYIDIDQVRQKISFQVMMINQDPVEFRKLKDEGYYDAFANVENMNRGVERYNKDLKSLINEAFKREKDKYLKENAFFEAINIKINPNTQSVFSAPTITKKNIPQPELDKKKEFSSEPMMSTEMYNDVLRVIYDFGKNMEKKPSMHSGKSEENLRELFVSILETRYDGTTATGETFNRSGKTDILLKYAPDASNLFVAECKFWTGPAGFLDALSQLFERYLTWRDSKVAILVFVRNKDFSNVLFFIQSEIKNHSLYIKDAGHHGESSFSYIFCLPQDHQKQVLLEVMAFHYDK